MLKTTQHDGLEWPAGYCLDPNGRMCVPDGQAEAWNFGYEIGYREAMAVKMRAAGQLTPNEGANMTKQDVERMAREAWGVEKHFFATEQLERFAAAVAAVERERCAAQET